jgi:hypothetical protein
MSYIVPISFIAAIGIDIIPAPDPLGYPVPVWILQSLSYFTLTLHLLAMNFTIGGSIILLWSLFSKNHDNKDIGRFFGAGLPLGVSYIVTLGIPPLLFVQVLYGQFFYSSSLLIGSFWIQVIPVLLLAYTGYYYHKFLRDTRPRYQWFVVIASLILLLYIGFIYVNNLTLAMTPEKWSDLYKAYPGGGNLTHGEPTIHPRLLLFLSGAFAAAGIALIWRGAKYIKWGYDEAGKKSQQKGFKIFLISIPVWIIAAAGVYFSRPDDISAMLSLANSKLLFGIGIISTVIAIIFSFLAVGKRSYIFPFISSMGIFGAVISMVIFRDMVRIHELSPGFDLSMIPVNNQWGMFAIFMATLVIGLAFLIIMFAKVFPAIEVKSRERLKKELSAG